MSHNADKLLKRLQEGYKSFFSRLNERLSAPRWRAFAVVINYYRTFKLEGENAGVSFYSQLWSFGVLGRIALTLLLVGMPVVALSVTEQLRLMGVVNSVPVAALVTGLLLFSAGWAFVLAVSVRAHLLVLCLACLYFYYYALLPAMGYLFHPTFAIPVFWALYLIRCRVLQTPLLSWWPLWVAPVCVIAGFLTFPSFGLHTLFEEPLKTWLKFTLGAFYFLMVTVRTVRFSKPPQNLQVFLLSWSTLLTTYTAAGIADIDALAESTILGFQGAIVFFSLFLMWLGISFFGGAQGLGSWMAREWSAVLPHSIARAATISIWGVAALFCWLAVHEVPMPLESVALTLRSFFDVQDWSYEMYFAVYGQFYVSVGLVFMSLLAALRGRLAVDTLVVMNGLWLATFLLLLGYYATSYSVAEFGRDKVDISFWTLLLFLGGLTWRIIKSELFWQGSAAGEGKGEPGATHFRGMFSMVAMLLLMQGVTAVLFASGDQQLVLETRLQPLLGIIYIGLPYLCYKLILQSSGHSPMPTARLMSLFGLGCFSASLCLGFNHYAGPELVIAPLAWLIALLIFKYRDKTVTMVGDGLLAGAAMASGFIAYWMLPTVIPLPFLELLIDWQASYTLNPPLRPHMQNGQLGLSILAIFTGAGIGMAVYAQRMHAMTRVALVAAMLIVLPVLTPYLPGLSGPQAATGEDSAAQAINRSGLTPCTDHSVCAAPQKRLATHPG